MNDDSSQTTFISSQWCCCAQFCFSVCRLLLFVLEYTYVVYTWSCAEDIQREERGTRSKRGAWRRFVAVQQSSNNTRLSAIDAKAWPLCVNRRRNSHCFFGLRRLALAPERTASAAKHGARRRLRHRIGRCGVRLVRWAPAIRCWPAPSRRHSGSRLKRSPS